ncbi:MAG: transposase [Planctomycetes bacterium]|nr:transposase [Planctomycetota bacterium]
MLKTAEKQKIFYKANRAWSESDRRNKKMNYPLAYLITFTTYGTWLHGDKRGSVDRNHNEYGSNFLPKKREFEQQDCKLLKNDGVLLDEKCRNIVLNAIISQCDFRNWFAYAVHVRSNHIHIVVSALEKPEKIMTILKSYSTRNLRASGINKLRFWTTHGSTKYLWTKEKLDAAIQYVRDRQGRMMAYGCTKKTEPGAKATGETLPALSLGL